MKKIGLFRTALASCVWLLLGAGSLLAAPVVLFDQGHDQRFLVESSEPLHLSGLAALFGEEGYTVRTTTAPITDETLLGVDVLVISGPFRAIEVREVEALVRFMERGGRLAAMLHIGSPFTELVRRLEVDFTNYVLYEQENVIDNDPRNFQVKNLVSDPLYDGLEYFSLYGGWALVNTAPSARIIAFTSPKGWVDLNRDKRLSKGDVVQPFGVVAVGEVGAGRFVLFGDDAVFQNRFLDENNRKLARNLARRLK